MSGPVLILGAEGQVGRATLAALQRDDRPVVGLARRDLDITDGAAIEAAFAGIRPSVVINAAAWTAVDAAEAAPEQALAVNGHAPGLIAAAVRHSGGALIHLSTDYVFDGRKGAPYVECDPPAPLSAYGRSKQTGEAAVIASGVDGLVVRTSWLLSSGGFVGAILSRARAGEALRVVQDQSGRPTLVDDLAEALCALSLSARLAQPARLYHYAGATDATWLEVAEALTETWSARVGVARPVLTGIASTDWPAPARRPLNSRLDSSRIVSDFGLTLHDWRAAVPDLVEAWLQGNLR
ncbi:dTDP-4-dehydrorhamnose reductase [Brevundimonas diminuta]|uniref:dTDP-4-dehydrorhamnose reductase n=1 Tax=Brevundimonas diminuta TaxID=293 RepID=UPI00320825D1